MSFSSFRSVVVICIGMSPLWPNVTLASDEQPDRIIANEHIKSLIASLPPSSHWRDLLQHGMKGDGVHHSWMDDMRKADVKLATFRIEFTWSQNGKEQKDWTVVGENYFHDYDQVDRITDPQRLSLIRSHGLEQELKEAALARAKIANWSEYPPEEQGRGYRLVPLADNEWLPVDLSPFFGRFEPDVTPLMQAAALGDLSGIKKLLSKGADVNEVNARGLTPLIYAAGGGDDPAVMSALLKAGADVNAKAKGGVNALVAAVANNRPRNAAILLKAGADPNSRNADGETALSIATRRHYPDVVRLLEQAGAHE